jgi:hypothetical protein
MSLRRKHGQPSVVRKAADILMGKKGKQDILKMNFSVGVSMYRENVTCFRHHSQFN